MADYTLKYTSRPPDPESRRWDYPQDIAQIAWDALVEHAWAPEELWAEVRGNGTSVLLRVELKGWRMWLPWIPRSIENNLTQYMYIHGVRNGVRIHVIVSHA